MSECRAQQLQSGMSCTCQRCGATAGYGEKLPCRLPEEERVRTMEQKAERKGETKTVEQPKDEPK